MSAFFPDDQLDKIASEYLTVSSRYTDLALQFFIHAFTSKLGKEFALQGFIRRLKTIVRCIDNVFKSLPPNTVEPPTEEVLSDAVINIQACMFNVFGSVDNLAWTWVYERDLRQPDGSPIPHGWVGLRPDNTFVRSTFSEQFRANIKGFDAWFSLLEDYRHALAHRIALYIPPFIIDPKDEGRYHEIQAQKIEALQRQDKAEQKRLSDEEKSLQFFRPLIMHSFSAKTTPIIFHGQMLSDFLTVVDLGERVLQELKRSRDGQWDANVRSGA